MVPAESPVTVFGFPEGAVVVCCGGGGSDVLEGGARGGGGGAAVGAQGGVGWDAPESLGWGLLGWGKLVGLR